MRESALAVLLAWTLAAQHGLCGKLEKIAQQQSNFLVDYYAYRHISIIHFNVPERTVAVVFKYVSVRKRPVGSSLTFYMQCTRFENTSVARFRYFPLFFYKCHLSSLVRHSKRSEKFTSPSCFHIYIYIFKGSFDDKRLVPSTCFLPS